MWFPKTPNKTVALVKICHYVVPSPLPFLTGLYGWSYVTQYILVHYGWSYVSIVHSPELYGTEGAGELKKLMEKQEIYVDKFHPLPEKTNPAELEKVAF